MFEWDKEKRLINLEKHGVDFADAALIFENGVIESTDNRADYGELRVKALGHVENDYFVVIYTWRGEKRRLISAWRVGNEQKRKYRELFAGRA